MIESTRSFGPLRVSEVSGKSYGRRSTAQRGLSAVPRLTKILAGTN
jgi:hypothetical protein